MPTEYKFDVFISYSSKDKEWVRGELLERLEKAGLKAFIDYRDFTRGAPSIKEMERGVVKCRKTLLILTPDYIESGWGEIENIMVQTLDPANRELRLIPLLRIECEKPLRIATLTHIDFTDSADLDLAWRQLLTALGRPPEPEPPKEQGRDEWFLAHPYPMPPNFTGRIAEREMLTKWLVEDDRHPMLVLHALGGFGKSALVWHWLMNDVKPDVYSRVVWWSFYEGDASFDSFIAETTHYVSDGKNKRENPTYKEVRQLLKTVRSPGTLFILDGFERVLRAYGGLNAVYQGDELQKVDDNYCDCISPQAELFLRSVAILPGVRAKVLLTTRLFPRVLETNGGGLLQGCREEKLDQMQPGDAVKFFHAQGVRGTRAEIEAACRPYGFHPLSLRLLAGLIVGDLQQPGDISVATRLDVSGELVQHQHHVLETAYKSLTSERQVLLSRIACFRNPVKYEALKALASKIESLDSDLRDLVVRGLLHHRSSEGRFDLHPIVRRYAYDLLAARDRAVVHYQLIDYFAAVVPSDIVNRVDELAPVIELYHHTIRASQYNEAFRLFCDRINKAIYYQFGAYQLQIDLLREYFSEGQDCPLRLKDENDQAWVLNELANSYSNIGQPHRAIALLEQQNAIQIKLNNKRNTVIGLGNVAQQQFVIGKFRATESSLHRRNLICKRIKNERMLAIGHREVGRLLAYRGAFTNSKAELTKALEKYKYGKNSLIGTSISWCYSAQCRLLKLVHFASYEKPESQNTDLKFALDSVQHALKLADEWTRTKYPVVRIYVVTYWLLGLTFNLSGEYSKAEHYLNEGLERCRRINMVDHEADILIGFSRLRLATGLHEDAQRFAEEALFIAERCGYVLQGADANLELAKLAIARGDKTTALEHAKEARRLATCDGPPDYTYKVAYDEAGAMLEQLEE